jgi:hypothetical protein
VRRPGRGWGGGREAACTPEEGPGGHRPGPPSTPSTVAPRTRWPHALPRPRRPAAPRAHRRRAHRRRADAAVWVARRVLGGHRRGGAAARVRRALLQGGGPELMLALLPPSVARPPSPQPVAPAPARNPRPRTLLAARPLFPRMPPPQETHHFRVISSIRNRQGEPGVAAIAGAEQVRRATFVAPWRPLGYLFEADIGPYALIAIIAQGTMVAGAGGRLSFFAPAAPAAVLTRRREQRASRRPAADCPGSLRARSLARRPPLPHAPKASSRCRARWRCRPTAWIPPRSASPPSPSASGVCRGRGVCVAGARLP